jgi:hypothetical protein
VNFTASQQPQKQSSQQQSKQPQPASTSFAASINTLIASSLGMSNDDNLKSASNKNKMTFGPKLVSQEIRLKSATKLILLVESL